MIRLCCRPDGQEVTSSTDGGAALRLVNIRRRSMRHSVECASLSQSALSDEVSSHRTISITASSLLAIIFMHVFERDEKKKRSFLVGKMRH